MRLPARRIATTVLTAGLLIGLSGPAVMAADGESVRERTHAASAHPCPTPPNSRTRSAAWPVWAAC